MKIFQKVRDRRITLEHREIILFSLKCGIRTGLLKPATITPLLEWTHSLLSTLHLTHLEQKEMHYPKSTGS